MTSAKSPIREKAVDFLVALLLSWSIGTASLLCLDSAFPLPADRTLIISVIGLCSFGTSLAYLFSKGWIAVFVSWIAGLGVILIWYPDFLVNGTKEIFDTLLTFYSNAYPFLPFSVGPIPPGYTATLPMCLWGAMVATLCAWTVLKQQTPVGVLILSAFPLALCMVVLDTPPDRSFLFAYLMGIALLLITQGCRRRNRGAGSRLCLLLMVPTALLVLGLHAFLPEASYTRSPWSDSLLHHAEQLVPGLSAQAEPPPPDSPTPSHSETPLTMGPPRYTHRAVMELTAPTSGAVYLRGRTYAEYSSDHWNTMDSRQYDDSSFYDKGLFLSYRDSEADTETMHIRTYGIHEVLYTPYFLPQLPQQGRCLQDHTIENSDHIGTYDISYCPEGPQALSDPDFFVSSDHRTSYDEFVHENYTKLPWDTRKKATDYLQSHGFAQAPATESNPSAYAQQIARLVRSSATYDATTPAMPKGKDFAIWFLEESPTGYCVHFASASVVLLRAAGIPARFVTGYLVNAQAGTPVPVLDSNAHAWAEYYADGIGWIPLEATPADAVEHILRPEEPTTPDTTGEPHGVTEEPTVPAKDSLPTEPAPSPSEGTTLNTPKSGGQFRIPGWIFLIAMLIFSALAYCPALLFLRRSRLRRLSENEAFLLRWHYCCSMARWLKVSQDPCMDLALKARFSQHSMEKEDWKALHSWQAQLRSELSTAPFIKRFLIRRVLLWDRRL